MLDKLKGYKRIIALAIFVINGALVYTGTIDKGTSKMIFAVASSIGLYGTWDSLQTPK